LEHGAELACRKIYTPSINNIGTNPRRYESKIHKGRGETAKTTYREFSGIPQVVYRQTENDSGAAVWTLDILLYFKMLKVLLIFSNTPFFKPIISAIPISISSIIGCSSIFDVGFNTLR
jgi:hypothetical protein